MSERLTPATRDGPARRAHPPDEERATRRAHPPDEDGPPRRKPAARKGKRKKKRHGQTSPPERSGQGKPLRRFLIKLALFAAVLAGVFTFVLGVHIQHGNRMYPFIMDGDLLITYKLDPYRVGDAVAYRNPKTGAVEMSRIVAIGENQIEISEQGELRVNGYVPSESVFYPTHALEGSEVTFPYQVGPGGYFLLDDYREIGQDSRAFGAVPSGALQGKVVYVLRRRGI